MSLSDYFKENFSLDYRSLAAFRILYGLLLIADLIMRAQYLVAHYTQSGVFPFEAVQESMHFTQFSFHLLSGESGFIALLFLLQIVMAFMVVIGYRTRTFLLLSFIFLVSLMARNPLVLASGDNLLRVLYFWALFVPTAAIWSVDSLLKKNKQTLNSNTIASLGTVIFILQILSVYFFTGIMKTGDIWLNGDGVYYALQLDAYTTFIGDWLGKQSTLCTILTYITLYFERFGWLVFLIPFKWQWFRLVGVLLFMGMHLGFMFSMHLGLFPIICIFAWVALLPPLFWDKVLRITVVNNWFKNIGKRVRSAVNCLIEKEWIQSRKIHEFTYGFKYHLVAAFLMILVTWWNLSNAKIITMPAPITNIVRLAHLEQSWGMFAPAPFKADGWYVAAAELSNGTKLDLLTGLPYSYEKPADVSDTYINQRWRKYLNKLFNKKNKKYRRYFVNYLKNKWNKKLSDSGTFIETVSLDFVLERTLPNYEVPKQEKVVLWRFWQDEKFKTNFED